MKVKIIVTTESGIEQELEREIDFKGSTNIIGDLEREISGLKSDISVLVSQAKLKENQALFSKEKKRDTDKEE